MDKKELSSGEVRHIGELAKLELSDEEVERYRGQLVRIFDYIGQIDEMKTDGIEQAHHPTMQVSNVFREDFVDESGSLSQQECLENAPATHDGFFVVPGILNKLDS